MTYKDEPNTPEVEEEDPKPELQVVPIEDLDRVEKLLDVARNTIDMPNLPNIKAACMAELKQIDDSMIEPMEAAQEEYRVALAEWEAKKEAKRVEKEKEARLLAKKAEEERRAKEEEAGRDPDVPQSVAGAPRDTVATPVERRL